MAQSKILLDTNSYLRLARSIHPLLFQCFGDEDYCLYALKALEDEVRRSRRLVSKFDWFDNAEFRENRSRPPRLSKKEKRSLEITQEALWDHASNVTKGPSRVDCEVLAVGLVLGIPVVTDDKDMTKLAEEFEITVMSTLQLLSMMLESDHIELQKVREIAAYWAFDGDCPANYRTEFQQLFGEPAPLQSSLDG